GRVRSTTVPASATTEAGTPATTTQSYALVAAADGFGHWLETTVIDATGSKRATRRNVKGRIREVIEYGHPDGEGGKTSATTRYTYDALGQLVRVTDALGNATTVQY